VLFAPLNSTPDPTETVARYIFDRNHFAPDKARVKPKAFEPAAVDRLTSVFRIVGLTDAQIWDLGVQHVESVRGRASLARADIAISKIVNLGLQVQASEPPPRHANIAGWSNEKDANMSIAQQLAAEARLVVRSTPAADRGAR
jgi:hypothetical protein